jgi:hypothetical protein
VVDRATTHYGKMITDWLAENHSSESPTKIFIEYIQEGMISVQQVCDIAVNKPLKALIKKEYAKFRLESIRGKSAQDLVGRVLVVPRENLVEMIETAVDEINHQNQRRHWIARALDQCGQDPWSVGQNEFEKHLDSLTENAVYAHMIGTNKQLNLQ